MQQVSQSPRTQGRGQQYKKDHRVNWWLTAVVAVMSLTILVPLYFTVVTALKTPAEAGTFSLPSAGSGIISLMRGRRSTTPRPR
jgi:raffinose/stachyose/melibiose transport system permease protein